MSVIQLARAFLLSASAGVMAGCFVPSGTSAVSATEPKAGPSAGASVRIILASEVQWEALNPARGASSPLAGTLWGDRNGEQPTGFLASFADGFSSPPHIHNVSYRAVVIDGGIHNDDPQAARMWMPNGSFWTQPMGETHITAANGASNMALVEIDRGPYLVRPPDQAFDSGERPVNLDAANVVWLPLRQQDGNTSGAQVAYLWGKFGRSDWNSSFVRLPAGFEGVLASNGDTFHGVVIRGQLNYRRDGVNSLTPGSYFGAQGQTEHRIASDVADESIIYIRTNGPYQLHRSD